MESNANEPTFLFDDLPFHWQMTRCEKYALISLLNAVEPDVSIEIGRYKGGSLQVISRKSKKVYSIDVSSQYDKEIEEEIENAEIIVGDSKKIIPKLLSKIEKSDDSLDFVLVDGDHSEGGVKKDVDNVIKYRPKSPCYIVFHDSFHPPCRRALLAANWHKSDHVHYVEIDFIPGVYHHEAFDTAQPRSMYGGLALALLRPEKRTEELVVHQSQKGLFESTLSDSRHGSGFGSVSDKINRVKSWLLRVFG